MFDSKQYFTWVLELTNYFVKKHQYQIVSLSKDQSDTWLVNPKNTVAPIILISARPTDALSAEVLSGHRSALAAVFNVKNDGLYISVNQESMEFNDHLVMVGPFTKTPSSLIDTFQDVENVLRESDHVQKSYNKAFMAMKKSIKKSENRMFFTKFKSTAFFSVLISIFFIASTALLLNGLDEATVAVMVGGYYKDFIVNAFEYFRLLTAGFVHISFFHFLINLMALRNLGTVIEPIYGSKKMTLGLLAGIVYGNIFVFIMSNGGIGVGISGGLFALMGMLVVYMFESGAIKNPRIRQGILMTLMMNLIISLLPGISWGAHLGGLQAGLVLGVLFSKRPDWSSLRKGLKMMFALFTLALVLMMAMNLDTTVFVDLNRSVIQAWHDLGFNGYAQYLLKMVGV